MDGQLTQLPGVIILEPKVFGDERGFFFESFNEEKFNSIVRHPVAFVQDNHSCSQKGVIRGLHYQLPPFAQGKLVRVVAGAVFDVAVDLRRSSSTFGKWVGVTLTAENKKQLWIPPGFAHGFCALSDNAEFLYKTTAFYSAAHERCIRWNDEHLKIDWPAEIEPIISSKDAKGVAFADADYFA